MRIRLVTVAAIPLVMGLAACSGWGTDNGTSGVSYTQPNTTYSGATVPRSTERTVEPHSTTSGLSSPSTPSGSSSGGISGSSTNGSSPTQ